MMTPEEWQEAYEVVHEMQAAKLQQILDCFAQEFVCRYGLRWREDDALVQQFAEVERETSKQWWAQVARLQAGTFDHRTVQ